jgi:hypothetical protein
VTVAVQVPVELERYLDELVERLAQVADVVAVYLIGSAAFGAYEPERSDVDVIAVTARLLADDEKRALAAAAEALPCPARKLELVVYPRGSDRWQINLNTGEHLGFDPDGEPSFWFVLDRAIAEQHAVPLLGPPWADVFEPVPREAIVEAIRQALDWQQDAAPGSVINACRAWMWLETGAWASKREAAAWVRERVREAAR